MALGGIPVVIAQNGRGVAVKPVEAHAPCAVVAANGLGTPVVISDSGTPMIVDGLEEEEDEPELGPWIAGSNTVMSIADGRVRAARSGGGNPRVSRHVTGLEPGYTYRVQSNTYAGPAVTSVFFRVSSTSDLTQGDYLDAAAVGTIDRTFQAPVSGEAYIGIAVATQANGEYGETDEIFVLQREED